MTHVILNSPQIENLTKLMEEAIRSTDSAVRRFVEPAPGTLQQATNKTHCIVFGRRGSGKSSLLRKAKADLTIDRRPIAYVDLESFKGHSYPDVLLSVLIKTFREFRYWLDTAAVYPATRKSFWDKLFAAIPTRPSFRHKEAKQLSTKLEGKIKELEKLLYAPDDTEIQRVTKNANEKSTQGDIEFGLSHTVDLGAKAGGKASSLQGEEIHESYRSNKVDFLNRHVMEYQQIFHDMKQLSDGDSYLILDDLYYIKRSDQAKVIDYFHRIAKNNGLWLKIGTIRHRTDWYVHGDPPFGMKIGDDTGEINLDLTLEDYESTKEFLKKILEGLIQESGNLRLDDILVDNAIDRLVMASGGVARDFLGIFQRSLVLARGRRDIYHRPRIGSEDVNAASGLYSSTKREEFKIDTAGDEDQPTLEESLNRVINFCFQESQYNLFLVEPNEENQGYKVIQELVDLRLIHKARSRVTISKRPGKIYEAYMLDVSEYTHSRKRRGLDEMRFWGDPADNIRRLDLVLSTDKLVDKVAPIELSEDGHKKDAEMDKGKSGRKATDKNYEQLPLSLPESNKPNDT